MKFNLVYVGPARFANYQRDFIVLLHNALTDLGHTVFLSLNALERDVFNLVIGGHDVDRSTLQQIMDNYLYAVISTEIVSNDKINERPKEKTDFLGAYLPFLKKATFIWDITPTNIDELAKYGCKAVYLPMGYHPRLEEIQFIPESDKDVDVYFFGLTTEPRIEVLKKLEQSNLRIYIHDYGDQCPVFVRNSVISRTRITLNLSQHLGIKHLSNLRAVYLATNRCYGLTEQAEGAVDVCGCLRFIDGASTADFVDRCVEYVSDANYRRVKTEEYYNSIRQFPMTSMLDEILSQTFD